MRRPVPSLRILFVTAFAALLPRVAPAEPLINEFLAINDRTSTDADGHYYDWIELHNPDSAPVSLDGWYLTDTATRKDKWKFPAVTLPANGYLVVFASNKNNRDPAKELHTNFVLEGSGEYLALVRPDGTTVVSEFSPGFPEQFADISYGVTQPTAAGESPRTGYFRTPTPGARNGGTDTLLLLERVTFARAPGPFVGTVSLTMSGAAAGQRIRYVLSAPGPAGITFTEPTATVTLYSGPVTISASTVVRAAVFSDDDRQRGFTSTAQYVRIANSGTTRLDTFTSQLPLLLIDSHGAGPLTKEDGARITWVYTWDRPAAGNTMLTTAPAVACLSSTSVRGSSSAEFPKKSFTLRFQNAYRQGTAQALYGLPAFDSWALVGPWNFDRSYIHNAFAYTVSNRIGRWAPRTQLVEVYLNTNGGNLDTADYAGIYVLCDRLLVDEKRVNITSIDPNDEGERSITGGYLLKVDAPDDDEFAFRTARNYPVEPSLICVATPKLADLPRAQQTYVQGYIQAMEDALHTDLASGFRQRTHLDYIDRASWVDHHILNVLTENVDAFYRSAYFTKERGRRLEAGPVWDLDRSMHGGDLRSQTPEEWNGGGGATVLWEHGWWGLIARDPEFMQAWVDRWQSLRKAELSTANLLALVDELAARIGTAAAARDAAKWPNNAQGEGNTPRFPGGWQGEIDNLKSWLSRRVAWIDQQFTAAPALAQAAGRLTLTPATGTQVAYTTDGTDPRVIGGGFSFGARLATAPVSFPDTTELRARSYRPNFDRQQFPGSAWSAPVLSPRASPLAPAARLANLSSRGFVGNDENMMIAGIVVNDTAGKLYLARAVGPALAEFGVTDALTAPVLSIADESGREIARNSGWSSGRNADEIADVSKAVGAFPFAKNSHDCALLTKLPYGRFTLQIGSTSTATGVALVELYEVDPAIGRTLNLSTRGRVRSDGGLLIGGVVVSAPGPKRLLVRAIGPTLGLFGVGATLPDPVLTVFSGSTALATNDDWGTPVAGQSSGSDIAAAAAKVGAFGLPADSRDSALLLTVPPGAYTVQVEGKANAEGIILFEIYEVP